MTTTTKELMAEVTRNNKLAALERRTAELRRDIARRALDDDRTAYDALVAILEPLEEEWMDLSYGIE